MDEKPNKPIRKRVRRACTACRKSKTSCTNVRPCARCVRTGKPHECMDLPITGLSSEDHSAWMRIANYLQDPASVPKHVVEALAYQLQAEPTLTSPTSDRSSAERPSGGDSPPSPDNSDMERETLNSTVACLKMEKDRLQSQLQRILAESERVKALQHSYYYFGLTSGSNTAALSQWSFPDVKLTDFNVQFEELSARPRAQLTDGFTCKELFMQSYVQRCAKVLKFLADGTVASLTVPQVWAKLDGTPIYVTSMVYVRLDEQTGRVSKVFLASTPTFEQTDAHSTAFFPEDVVFRGDGNTRDHVKQLTACHDSIRTSEMLGNGSATAAVALTQTRPFQFTATPLIGHTQALGTTCGFGAGSTMPAAVRPPPMELQHTTIVAPPPAMETFLDQETDKWLGDHTDSRMSNLL